MKSSIFVFIFVFFYQVTAHSSLTMKPILPNKVFKCDQGEIRSIPLTRVEEFQGGKFKLEVESQQPAGVFSINQKSVFFSSESSGDVFLGATSSRVTARPKTCPANFRDASDTGKAFFFWNHDGSFDLSLSNLHVKVNQDFDPICGTFYVITSVAHKNETAPFNELKNCFEKK